MRVQRGMERSRAMSMKRECLCTADSRSPWKMADRSTVMASDKPVRVIRLKLMP